jgi:AraC family transcriptional regulator
MQDVKAVLMRGKRIKMSAYLKAEDVRWAALWMRVDGPEGIMLGFDNMADRPVKGTHDWRKYEVVLDVAEASIQVAFGVLLAEQGRVWADDFEFEEVGDDVATTDLLKGMPVAPGPVNLGFEDEDTY